MFTGIVKEIGCVARVEEKRGGVRLYIRSGLDLDAVEIGASIACGGCCLTVVDKGEEGSAADVSAESLSKTTIGTWAEGKKINLEPALRTGDEIGGHLVTGHVDGLAVVEDIREDGESHRLTLRIPKELAGYIASKGSVTLDGVSLTVNEVQGARFGVNIIPHTWAHTSLGGLKPGDSLHVEIDVLARYVARILEERGAA